jgi:hypothetical protein
MKQVILFTDGSCVGLTKLLTTCATIDVKT